MNTTQNLPTCLKSRRPRLAAAALAAATALTASATLPAQTPPEGDIVALDEMVVSATRSPQDIQFLPSSVTRLDLGRLEKTGVRDMRDALAFEPGVIVVNTGAAGALSSVFLRGANTHQTLFFVDGVRINDKSASYGNLLGAATLLNVGRLEVLRGQQSTLYGSSAMGGVIAIETAPGRDQLGGTLTAEAGSFSTFGAAATVAGTQGQLGYSAWVARRVTDNDRDFNTHKAWEYSGRVDFAATADLTVGATFRGQLADYEEPGSTYFPSAGTVDSKNHLLTVYGELRLNDALTSRLTGGLHRRDYKWTNDWGQSTNLDRREIVDWTTTWESSENLEIVAGINHERAKVTVGDTRWRDELLAAYASGILHVNEAFTITAGIRNDHYDSVGGAATWRAGASWQLTDLTRVRGTYGTGFSAPAATDRFGVPSWGLLPNPDLLPEKSRGWDIGIDQDLNFAGMVLSATWFDNHFKNLFEWETIDYTTFEGMIVNRARASTRGLELAFRAQPHSAVTTRLAYTYLRAKNDETGDTLIRRPEHTLNADISVQISRQLLAGAGVRFVANRTDSVGPMPDYVTARLFGRYQLNESLVISARVENLLNETYEEVAGYPALPIGGYAGIEWRF
ncbi:MAG: TonB-dependent receptor [Verrucomicrobia bacterium]|nr:MAG: TonB-dependent receptor [Verrucomicrobiota bacterium]